MNSGFLSTTVSLICIVCVCVCEPSVSKMVDSQLIRPAIEPSRISVPMHVVENQGWVHPTSRVVGPIRRLLPYKAFQDRSLSTITPGLPLSLGRSRETTDSRFQSSCQAANCGVFCPAAVPEFLLERNLEE